MVTEIQGESDRTLVRGAALATVSGAVAAFAVASCCALPVILATAGIGTAWLGAIAALSAPHRNTLFLVSLVALLASALLLWRIQRRAQGCPQSGGCAPQWVRLSLLGGLLAGAALLWAGYAHV